MPSVGAFSSSPSVTSKQQNRRMPRSRVLIVEGSHVSPFDFDVLSMPKRFAEVGDKHAGLADHAFGIEPLLELAERQEKEKGLGDLPYPPDYPKMPGEPPRVQPSKKVAANWDEDGNRQTT